jgi:hypothetical protein
MLKSNKTTLLNRTGKLLRAFARDEDGGIIILTLLLLITMLVVGGMAVDFMRFESERAELQSVSDRAVLAAADLNQTLDEKAVVRDFFKAAGFEDRIVGEPFKEFTGNSRTVLVESAVDLNTFYLRLIGIDELNVPARSAAIEGIGKVEISLVLDISGSMRFGGSGDGGRFADMQRAAKSFAAKVLDPSNGGQVSLNIIPYAGSTNPGPEMFAYLDGVRYNNERLFGGIDEDTYEMPDGTIITEAVADEFPNVSSCLEFTADDWLTDVMPGPMTEVDDDTPLTESASANGRQQVPHFMNWAIAADVMDWGWCPQDRSAIRYALKDYCVAERFIDGIRMHDGTGTHYGMKYGLAALAPETQAAFAALSVLTTTEEVNPDYVPSAACVGFDGGTGAIDDGTGTDTGDASGTDGDGGTTATTTASTITRAIVPVEFSNRPAAWNDPETKKIIILMTDGQITDQFRPVNIFHANLLTQHLWGGNKTTLTARSANLTSFYAACNLAKNSDRDIAVYTVAFETYGSGKTEMQNCASKPSMFYPAAGEQLINVFNDIAEQITDLRLSL